jgi:nitrite reductase/ring-hydroxylating ferredoxin subunit
MTGDTGSRWHKVANAADVPAGGMIQVDVKGELIAVYNLGGVFYATSDLCTHAEVFLSNGFIDGENVECPYHHAVFHIPTGRVLCAPAQRDLKTYPVRQENGAIHIEL